MSFENPSLSKPASSITINPNRSSLVDSLLHDVNDFTHRFTGYIDQKEMDTIQSLSHDMQVFNDQWNMSELRKTMSNLITKMEVIESSYIKNITIDQDMPLQQFNQELHAMMNQHRLSHDFSLNQLSWWSRLDYRLFTVRSFIKRWFDNLGIQYIDSKLFLFSFIHYSTYSIVIWLLIALVVLFLYQQRFNPLLYIDYVLWGIVWCCAMAVWWVTKKTWYINIIWSILLIWIGYIAYQFITINFWL